MSTDQICERCSLYGSAYRHLHWIAKNIDMDLTKCTHGKHAYKTLATHNMDAS